MTWINHNSFRALIQKTDIWSVEQVADLFCDMKNQTVVKYGFSFDCWFKVGYIMRICSYAQFRISYTEFFLYDTLEIMDSNDHNLIILDQSYFQTGFAIKDDNGEEMDIEDILEDNHNYFNTIDYDDLVQFIER